MYTSALLLGLTASMALASPNPEPQITGTPAPSQSAAIASALSNLESNLELNFVLGGAAEIGSVTSAIATAPEALRTAIEAALPNEATSNYAAFASAVNNIVTGSPVGFGALPTAVQGFVKSVASDEASIFNNGGSTAAPTTAATGGAGRVEVFAGLVGVGLVGAVLL